MKKIQEHLGLVFLIIIAIFAVAIGGYFTLRKGVFIGDDFYYKVRADKFVHNTVNYVERTKDDTFLLVADGKKQNVSYTMKGDQVTFSFADDTINGTWTGDQLLAADGSPVGWDEMQIIAGNEKPANKIDTMELHNYENAHKDLMRMIQIIRRSVLSNDILGENFSFKKQFKWQNQMIKHLCVYGLKRLKVTQ